MENWHLFKISELYTANMHISIEFRNDGYMNVQRIAEFFNRNFKEWFDALDEYIDLPDESDVEKQDLLVDGWVDPKLFLMFAEVCSPIFKRKISKIVMKLSKKMVDEDNQVDLESESEEGS